MGKILRILVFSFLLTGISPAGALDIVPYYTRNMSPVVQIFGLPPAEEGSLTEAGVTDVRFVLDIANFFTKGKNERVSLHLDGEIHRYTLALRRGISQRLELGVDIPYVRHTGGSFDRLIDNFHRTFGFPEGGRDRWDRDLLSYSAEFAGSGDDLHFNRTASGFGDILLTVAWQLTDPDERASGRPVALRGAVKLPTGDAGRFTGSQSTDLSLRLTGTDPVSLSGADMTWYWTLGALWMSEGKILSDYQRHVVGFGTLGLGWAPLSWAAFKLQFDGHTPFYKDLDLVQLDSASVQVVLGFSFELPWNLLFDIGLTEDLVVESAPDAVFHFALRGEF